MLHSRATTTLCHAVNIVHSAGGPDKLRLISCSGRKVANMCQICFRVAVFGVMLFPAFY